MATSTIEQQEIWKTVESFGDGAYAVSSFGRVKRITSAKGTYAGRILGGWRGNRYPQVHLKHHEENGKIRAIPIHIHILVAEAFCGPRPSPKHEVNHKDGDRDNNRPENLEWVTHSENVRHAIRTGLWVPRRGKDFHLFGRRGESATYTKLSIQQVREIRIRHRGGETGSSLAVNFGVSQSCISHIMSGKTWRGCY